MAIDNLYDNRIPALSLKLKHDFEDYYAPSKNEEREKEKKGKKEKEKKKEEKDVGDNYLKKGEQAKAKLVSIGLYMADFRKIINGCLIELKKSANS